MGFEPTHLLGSSDIMVAVQSKLLSRGVQNTGTKIEGNEVIIRGENGK